MDERLLIHMSLCRKLPKSQTSSNKVLSLAGTKITILYSLHQQLIPVCNTCVVKVQTLNISALKFSEDPHSCFQLLWLIRLRTELPVGSVAPVEAGQATRSLSLVDEDVRPDKFPSKLRPTSDPSREHDWKHLCGCSESL